MAEEKKFSEEELKQINEVADNYSSLQTELGNIGVRMTYFLWQHLIKLPKKYLMLLIACCYNSFDC